MKKKINGTAKCDKRIVTCDVGIAQCDDETVKCKKANGNRRRFFFFPHVRNSIG